MTFTTGRGGGAILALMRWMIIVNPVSGGGRHLPLLKKALKYFRKKGDEVVVHQTSGPGEGTEVARDRGRGFDAVVAAGGDGTIHEVIGGLAGTGVPLGILPWGTGNVFAKEMGLPRRVKALCKVIRKGHTVDLDLGLADGRPFLLMASVGLDAYALLQMSRGRSKKIWGMVAYALAGMAALVRYRHPPIEVVLDDGTRDRGSFLLVSNTRLYGAFFVFHPHADPTDGLLDVFLFRDSGRWKFLGLVVQMVWHRWTKATRPLGALGRHGLYQVKSLSILSGHARPMQVDGDFLEGGAIEIGIAPRALRVILPRRPAPPTLYRTTDTLAESKI